MKAKSALRSFLLYAGSFLLAASSIHAADGTWTQTGAGPFDWSAAATANWSGGTVADGQNSTANFTANITATQTVNLAEARTIGNITFTDSTTDSNNLTISGANILTLDRSSGTPVINVTQSTRTLTISSEISGNDGLQKNGLGTLILSGSNSYTGTTILRGGTLNLGGATANGSLASTELTLGGGTLSYTRTGSTTQSFTTTNIQPGATTASAVAGNTLDLGDLARVAGGTLNFGNTGSINTSETNDSTGILGAWATFNGGADWAINNGSGVAAAYTGYNTLAGAGPTLASSATTNHRVDNTSTLNITLATTGTIDANTLRISDAAPRTIDVRNGTTQGILRFGAVGGLLTSGGSHIIGVSGAGNFGTITAGGAADTAGELIVNSASALTINSVIANNGTGAVALTKSGSGTLTLNATNTFTGNTAINAGSLSIGSNNTAGARLGPATYAGNIFIAGGASLVFNTDQSQTLSGIISGDGTLQKAGGGTLTLSGNNTYTGKTTIGATGQGGPAVSVSSFNSVVGGTASSSLGAPTTVANGTIDLGSGTNFRNCTLTYTGAGETTDRVINVNFNTSASQTINAAGSGLLKFTSAFTINPSNGNKDGSFKLRGSGNGEIAGGIGAIPGFFQKLDAGTWTIGGMFNPGTLTPTVATLQIGGGTLSLQKQVSVYNNDQTKWIPSRISVDSGATLALGVGDSASGYFDATALATFLDGSHMGLSTTTTGFKSGANLGFDTTNATAETFTYSSIIGNIGTSTLNGLTKIGSGTLVLDQANTYKGTTTVSAGKLFINGDQTAADGAVGVSANATLGGIGTIGGSTTIANNGKLEFNLSTPFGSHNKLELAAGKTLVFSGTSTLTITSTGGASTGLYTLVTAPGGITWTSPPTVILPVGWTYSTITGNGGTDLVIDITSTGGGGSAYATWKAANAPGSNPDDDTDGDGVSNAVEFVLGGTSATKDLDKLPVGSTSGTDMLFTFYRAQSSIDPKTNATIELGTDLLTWTTLLSPYTVPDGAAANNPGVTVEKNNPASGTDKITLRVPLTPDAKKFARLKVAITP